MSSISAINIFDNIKLLVIYVWILHTHNSYIMLLIYDQLWSLSMSNHINNSYDIIIIQALNMSSLYNNNSI